MRFGGFQKLEILFLVVVDNLFRFPVVLELVQIDSVAFLTFFLINFLLYLFLGIGDHFSAIGIDGVITTVDFLLQTVVESSFP